MEEIWIFVNDVKDKWLDEDGEMSMSEINKISHLFKVDHYLICVYTSAKDEDFTVHTKRDLDVYVDGGHALLFWRNFHRDENVPTIEKIRSLFEVLRDIVEEESHRKVAFDYLRKKIYELKPLLRSTRDTKMSNSLHTSGYYEFSLKDAIRALEELSKSHK